MEFVDLSNFTLFVPQIEKKDYLIVSTSGRITITKSIRDLLSGSLNLSINKDGKQIIIQDNEHNNIKIKKDGSIKCPQFAQILTELKIQLNARYIIEYCEKQKLWFATFERENFRTPISASPGVKLPLKKKIYNKKNFEE